MATILPIGRPMMEVLPVELIHMICAFLPLPALSNFRLTCRDIAEIGEHYLVHSLHLMFSYKSFQNLLNISHHPTLRKYVSSILYEVRCLEEVDYSEFRLNVMEMDGLEALSMEDIQDKIASAWKVYSPMLDTQLHMKRTNYDFAVLAQALPRFPILKRIEMCSEYGLPSEVLARAYESTLAIPGLMIDGGEISDEEETGTRSLGSLLLAAVAIPSRLETLNAHRIHWSFFNPAPINLYMQAFTNLRHVDLVLEPDYDDWSEQDIVKARHVELGKALRAAEGLETLRLTFDDVDTIPKSVLIQRQMNVPVVWELITEDHIWPNLHTLELTVVTSSESEITDFLKRHARTLRVIRWQNMWLADSTLSWNKVFKKMKKYMKLDVVEFGGVWGGDTNLAGKPKMLQMEGEVGAKVARSIVRGRERMNKRAVNCLTVSVETLQGDD